MCKPRGIYTSSPGTSGTPGRGNRLPSFEACAKLPFFTPPNLGTHFVNVRNHLLDLLLFGLEAQGTHRHLQLLRVACECGTVRVKGALSTGRSARASAWQQCGQVTGVMVSVCLEGCTGGRGLARTARANKRGEVAQGTLA
jgi:hypothetical protein